MSRPILSVLHVGGTSDDTGGVTQYIRSLSGYQSAVVDHATFDVSVPDGTGVRWFARGFLKNVADVPALAARVAADEPDVVHVHSSQSLSFVRASVFAFVAKRLCGRPVVFHAHGSAFAEFVRSASGLVSILQRAVFGLADAVVCVSEDTAGAIALRVPAEKISVVRHGVRTDAYEPAYSGTTRVVLVASLSDRKGIPELLEALERLLPEHDFTVSIASTGPLADEVREFAARYPAVDYHGYVDEAAKRRLVSAGLVYVLPTRSEAGVPISLVEGMAGGNAIVSTPVTGIDELLDESNGRLVPPGDADALTDALAHFVERPDRAAAVGRANRQLAEAEFTLDRMHDRVLAVYRDVTDGEGDGGAEGS